MNDRPGVFGWLARLVSAYVGLAQTPRESAQLREEIAARRQDSTEPSDDVAGG